MQPPKLPPDEPARLDALRSLDVLDAPAEERFDRYTRLARRLFDVPIALVSLVDENRQWFLSRQGLDAPETPRDISFCGHSILDDQILVVEDAARDERFVDNPLVTGDPDIRFYAGFPLPGPGGHRLGTLCIIDKVPRTLSRCDREALHDIGTMVAHELAALQMATIDELTGLSNLRGFQVLARQALAACRRSTRPVALLAIDLDGFKGINDTFGHAEGDAALKEFASILRAVFRESDAIARPGGDEFCVLMTGCDAHDAPIALARLRDAIASRNDTTAQRYTLAFSAGIAGCPAGAPGGLAALLHDADQRMYRAKRATHDSGAPVPCDAAPPLAAAS